MSGPASSGVVVYRAGGEMDAIDEYCRRLVSAMVASGMATRYVADGFSPELAKAAEPAWVLLQYNPFCYGRSGFAPGLVRDVRRFRRASRARLAVMVHEAWVDMTDWKSTLIGLWQRAQLRELLGLADAVMTSTQALARELGGGAVHLPVATNITPLPVTREEARNRVGLDGELTVALFGTGHPSRALDHAEAAIAALAEARGPERLMLLNLGADAPPLRVPVGVGVSHPGRLSPENLSLHLSASDVVLLPFSDGLSTRRTTLMAALAHGRPVLGLYGRNTDNVLAEATNALTLTPVGDARAFSRAAVELTGDRVRLRAIGDAGRLLYEKHFDWPVLARSVVSLLETTPAGARRGGRGAQRARLSYARPVATRNGSISAGPSRSARELVFVCHDVGGSGGMERHAEQLVTRLLDAGLRVTVIARTCRLPVREGLRFVRVRTPRRPFALAYPAFFAVASALATGRGDALVHSTGAIVAGRVDVATVHYCHRAALFRVDGSRASRPGRLHRLNAAVAAVMARAGEAWCYRRGRVRMLCAVSSGVASELEQSFPAMAPAVRTVPNGVDSELFRPDASIRRDVRAELGLEEGTPLAVFVGGDWERKGLIHAIDALTHAPDWHLAVAGTGEREPLAARARRAGTESRLRFLGRVSEMPRLYAAADAFVLPTAYEAFPLVALEAAASAVPLLVTAVNGVEDLLQDGHGGWFIAPEGQDIARRLNQLRSDPELARAMPARARAAAAGYSWEAMVDAYLAIYQELAPVTRSPGASATAVIHR